MASSGHVNSSNYSNWYLQLNWTQTAKNSQTNQSTISWNVKTIRSSGSGSYYVGNISAVINGVTVYSCDNSNRWLMSNGATVASGTTYITHNNDGTKTFSASIKGAIYTYADNVSGSGSFTLDTIPRYATISQSLSARTETSLTIAWQTDATCDKLWYSSDNGSTFTEVSIGSATSGTYTITGLTANTTYNVKTRVRRKDSQLTSDSSALAVATYAYPYANSTPNFTLGNSVSIGIFNPLGRTVTVEMLDRNNVSVGSMSVSGTSANGFESDAVVNALYASIPSATNATYSVKVTYGVEVATNQGGTYSIDPSVCSPEIGSATYADTNATTQAIIQDTSQIVQNLGVVRYIASNLLAKKSASIASATVSVNGNTYGMTISGTTATGGNAVINSTSNVTAVFTVVDSRGLTGTASVDVTMLAWTLPTAIIQIERESNFYSLTNLKVDAEYPSLDSKNTITITYLGQAVAQTGRTTPSDVSGTLSDNVTAQDTFDNNFEWNIFITLTDAFNATATYHVFLSRGIPIAYFDRHRNSVGINMFPEHDGTLEVDGDIYTHGVNASDTLLECKNLFIPTAPTDTYRDITLTNNGDGTYDVRGTASGLADFYLSDWVSLADGDYLFNGITGGSDSTIQLIAEVNNNGTTTTVEIIDGDGAFTLNNGSVRLMVRVFGTAQVNTTIYPMIRNADITDGSFVPYCKTNLELTKELKNIADIVYPVGSIYMSVNTVDPSTLFGGTWEKLKDRFLLGSGDTYNSGDTGGEATHTLTVDEMPSHTHTFHTPYSANAQNIYNMNDSHSGPNRGLSDYPYSSTGSYINNTGGGQAHNNLPPYLVVNMWKRTA